MRRLLALLAAVAMVVASLVIRSRLDRNQGELAHPARLTCASELEATCNTIRDAAGADRLVLTVEAAGTTADRLAGATGDPGLDGWLVPEPWPDMVDIRRRTKALDPLFAGNRQPLGRSPLALVVWKDRAAVLAAKCGPPVGWKCLGDAAAGPWTAFGGRPEWGSPKPGPTDPDSAIGLLVLGQAVAEWFGRTDLSTIDLEDDGFSRWFSALERAPSSTSTAASPLDLMLAAGPAVYDATGAAEAEAGPVLSGSARRTDVDLLYPSPMPSAGPVTADVVLAAVTSSPAGLRGPNAVLASVRRLAGGDDARKALAANGWRVPGQPRVEGVTNSPLGPSTNLPPPGLLDALRGRWHEVTGR